MGLLFFLLDKRIGLRKRANVVLAMLKMELRPLVLSVSHPGGLLTVTVLSRLRAGAP